MIPFMFHLTSINGLCRTTSAQILSFVGNYFALLC